MSDQIGLRRTWYCYRLYGLNSEILYVGSTSNIQRRLSEHRSKPWFSEVNAIAVTEHVGRWRAMLAELEAGRGRFNQISSGIGKGLASQLTDDELREVLAHHEYRNRGNEELARGWGMPIARIRTLRSPDGRRTEVQHL